MSAADFALCRERVAPHGTSVGSGGHHEPGPVIAGYPVMRWICCADCPARHEVASAREEPPP